MQTETGDNTVSRQRETLETQFHRFRGLGGKNYLARTLPGKHSAVRSTTSRAAQFFFCNPINVLLIHPESLEQDKSALIDNSSISEHGGLPGALKNFQSIDGHNGLDMGLLKNAFS